MDVSQVISNFVKYELYPIFSRSHILEAFHACYSNYGEIVEVTCGLCVCRCEQANLGWILFFLPCFLLGLISAE